MVYINSTRNARIRARIETKESQLTAAETALENAMTEIESYSLNTGEGTQTTKHRKIEDLLEAIRILESEIDKLYRKLNGTGLINMNLRRKN